MTDVRVRGLDEDIVHLLKEQARRQGKDWQGFLHEALTDAALRPRRQLAAELQAFREDMLAKHGEMPDSTALIREDRDQWG